MFIVFRRQRNSEAEIFHSHQETCQESQNLHFFSQVMLEFSSPTDLEEKEVVSPDMSARESCNYHIQARVAHEEGWQLGADSFYVTEKVEPSYYKVERK